MKYQVKRVEIDPFCIMCGEGPMDEIEYWEDITEEELREMHEYDVSAQKWIPEQEKLDLVEDGLLVIVSENYSEWLQQGVADGYIRMTA